MSPSLRVDGLRKRFDNNQAVDGVSFSVDAGETFGLLGPNGAGKTTTISMIAGLLRPDEGTVEVAGQPMTVGTVAARSSVGLVPQELAIYPDLTGQENLSFFGKLYGMKGDALTGRIDEILDVIGLSDRRDDRTSEYSGGMQRRLNIGIGLLHRPLLLILDEPTVGVDPQSRNAILESVEKLSREGLAVLYTTHYMEEAERLCDRVAIIDEGRIVASGTQRQLVGQVGELDRIELTGRGDLEAAADRMTSLEGVESVTVSDDRLHVLTGDASARLPQVLTAAVEAGTTVTDVEIAQPDLEAVFLHLTGKALRD